MPVLCPLFIPLIPKGSLDLPANPPFSSPSGRNEENKYLYLCLQKSRKCLCVYLEGEEKK